MTNVTNEVDTLRSTHIHFKGGVNMGIGSFNLVRAYTVGKKMIPDLKAI